MGKMNPAVVAAVVSASIAGAIVLIKTVVDLAGGGRNAARNAHRELLGAYLADLGRDIPGVVAASTVYHSRVASGQSVASWQAKAEAHATGLKALRSNLRYLLYGADEGIRVLTRVSSWIQHFGKHSDSGQQLLDAADALRERLDRTIAKSYRRGEPPTWWDRRVLDRSAREVVQVWEARMGRDALGEPDP